MSTALPNQAEVRVVHVNGTRPTPAQLAHELADVAVAGWLLGVPLGYLLARGIVSLAGKAVGLDIASVFPVSYVLIALIGTVILALLIMLAPLRGAVRFKLGEAIRYA